jgi:predicted transcriptional regulator
MSATTSIRVSRETHQRLKEIAEKEQRSLGDVLDAAIAQYREHQFRRAVHESFRSLREDPAEQGAYLQDMAAWDVTLMDGLENEPLFEDDEV